MPNQIKRKKLKKPQTPKKIKPKMINLIDGHKDDIEKEKRHLHDLLEAAFFQIWEWQKLPTGKKFSKRNTKLYSNIKSLAREIYTALTGETNRIKVSSKKGKARWVQEWTARKISELTGIEWGKDKLIASRPMGQAGVDVILIDRAAELFPFSIECKSGSSTSWMASVKQAKKNQKKDQDWLVIMKHPDFKAPVVMLDGEKFFEIMDKYIYGEPE
jgi:hypothetical protein